VCQKELERVPFFMQTLGEITEPVMGDESLLIPRDTDLSEAGDEEIRQPAREFSARGLVPETVSCVEIENRAF